MPSGATPSPLDRFWSWYERHYVLNIGIASALFVLQLFHLYWLTTDVVLEKILGRSFFFGAGAWWTSILIAVDYTEIPALLTTSLVYLFDLRKSLRWKAVAFLLFLNIQWLHLFWITDEFVVSEFARDTHTTVLPVWLAWIAISIDYLELPVIVDTFVKFLLALGKMSRKELLMRLSRYYTWRR